jgi:hypothetical protein
MMGLERVIEEPARSEVFKKRPLILNDHHVVEFIQDQDLHHGLPARSAAAGRDRVRPQVDAGRRPSFKDLEAQLRRKAA